MRGRLGGNSCRPGCLPDPFVGRRTGACSGSACSIISLTTGSGSNNCICACESFSPAAPYCSIRISRRRSSSTRILSSAYCSLLFSCAISSRSAGAEGMEASTFPWGIVQGEWIMGNYIDGNGVYHGFLRTPDGAVGKFDVPGSGKGAGQGAVEVFGMTPAREIVGSYFDANNMY